MRSYSGCGPIADVVLAVAVLNQLDIDLMASLLPDDRLIGDIISAPADRKCLFGDD